MILAWAAVFVVSLALLVKGADWLLDSAQRVGRSLGLSPFSIGVVIVGFGTSLPELVSGLAAQFHHTPVIVPAAVIGSNTANILLIAALAAFLANGTRIHSKDLPFDLAWLALSASLFVFMGFDMHIAPGEALALLGLFAMYIVAMYAGVLHEEKGKKEKLSVRQWAMLGVGFAALIGGAHFLVDATVHIADAVGVGAGLISLLAIAVGTSLPELFVTVQAVRAHAPDVAIGNIFGSNIFNVLIVLGIPGVLGGMPIDTVSYAVGLPFMALATVALLWAGIRGVLSREEGILLMFLYTLFIALASGWL